MRVRPAWFPVRLVVYALVGASGTLAHYAAFVGLLELNVAALMASFCGYVLGAVVNYALNYRVTFRSAASHRDVAPRFFAVALAGLALNLVVLGVLMERLGLDPLPAQIVATALCLLVTYALNSAWSFRRSAPASRL